MSVYKVVEIIGTSTQSWEDAATTAVKTAGKTIRDHVTRPKTSSGRRIRTGDSAAGLELVAVRENGGKPS